MSQAVVDFCEGLKTVLLDVEKRVGTAQAALAKSAGHVEKDAKKQLDQAARQLKDFRIDAAGLAENIRKDFPAQAAGAQKALNEFGHEAQAAMRHMLVMMADAASVGADTAAHALEAGARSARKFADEARGPTKKPVQVQRKVSARRKAVAKASASGPRRSAAAKRRKRS
jgi:hypothetical protein